MNPVIAALIGAFLYVVIQLKVEKDLRDKNPKYSKVSWREWLGKNWDDFLFAFIVAPILGYFQEEIYSGLIHWREWDADKAWDIYFDTEYFISVGLGVFGTLIIQQLYKFGIKLIKALSNEK